MNNPLHDTGILAGIDPATIVVVALTALSGMVWLIIRAVRARREKQVTMLRDLGFVQDQFFEQSMLTQVAETMNTDTKLSGKDVYRKDFSDGRIYLFSPFSLNNNQNTMRAEVIKASRRDFPRFALYHKLKLPGFLGRAFNSLMESAIKSQLPRVDLGRFPEFDTAYFLFADDASAAVEHFNDEVRSRLLQGRSRYQISAAGDLFIVARADMAFQQNRNKMTAQQWRAHVDDIIDVFHTVAASRQGVTPRW